MVVGDILSTEQKNTIASKQTEYKNIVNNELQRLESKQSNMDTERDNQNRMIMLNRTYQQRQKAYIVLMVLFIIIFALCLAIIILQKRFGFSSNFTDFLVVFIIGLGFITAFVMYQNILSRDKIDFSKYSNNAAILIDAKRDKTFSNLEEEGNLSEMTGKLCVGKECCGPGFNYTNNKCV